MITLAMITLNVIHPGWFLVPEEYTEENLYKAKMGPRDSSTSADTVVEYQPVSLHAAQV